MSIREEAENGRQKLKNMSWKDRAWYAWGCYELHFLVVILVIGVLSTISIMIYHQTFTTRLSVAIISNRSADTSSNAPLEPDLREYLGCSKKDPIEISEGLMVDLNGESTSQHGYTTLTEISALVTDRSLDVVIGSQSVIDHYEIVSTYQSLEELFSPEFYVQMKDRIYRAKGGEGNPAPVALPLEDTTLEGKTGIIMDPPYLTVVQGSPHREAAVQVIEYLSP